VIRVGVVDDLGERFDREREEGNAADVSATLFANTERLRK